MFGEKIKEKRKRLNMTQKELADSLGMGRNGERTLRRWENNESSPSPIELNVILNLKEEFTYKNDGKLFKFIDLFCGIR